VPPEQVAARLIEEMLERGRSHLRRGQNKLSSKTNDTSGIGEVGLGQGETNDMKAAVRQRAGKQASEATRMERNSSCIPEPLGRSGQQNWYMK
jgi:hypothetical protein